MTYLPLKQCPTKALRDAAKKQNIESHGTRTSIIRELELKGIKILDIRDEQFKRKSIVSKQIEQVDDMNNVLSLIPKEYESIPVQSNTMRGFNNVFDNQLFQETSTSNGSRSMNTDRNFNTSRNVGTTTNEVLQLIEQFSQTNVQNSISGAVLQSDLGVFTDTRYTNATINDTLRVYNQLLVGSTQVDIINELNLVRNIGILMSSKMEQFESDLAKVQNTLETFTNNALPMYEIANNISYNFTTDKFHPSANISVDIGNSSFYGKIEDAIVNIDYSVWINSIDVREFQIDLPLTARDLIHQYPSSVVVYFDYNSSTNTFGLKSSISAAYIDSNISNSQVTINSGLFINESPPFKVDVGLRYFNGELDSNLITPLSFSSLYKRCILINDVKVQSEVDLMDGVYAWTVLVNRVELFMNCTVRFVDGKTNPLLSLRLPEEVDIGDLSDITGYGMIYFETNDGGVSNTFFSINTPLVYITSSDSQYLHINSTLFEGPSALNTFTVSTHIVYFKPSDNVVYNIKGVDVSDDSTVLYVQPGTDIRVEWKTTTPVNQYYFDNVNLYIPWTNTTSDYEANIDGVRTNWNIPLSVPASLTSLSNPMISFSIDLNDVNFSSNICAIDLGPPTGVSITVHNVSENEVQWLIENLVDDTDIPHEVQIQTYANITGELVDQRVVSSSFTINDSIIANIDSLIDNFSYDFVFTFKDILNQTFITTIYDTTTLNSLIPVFYDTKSTLLSNSIQIESNIVHEFNVNVYAMAVDRSPTDDTNVQSYILNNLDEAYIANIDQIVPYTFGSSDFNVDLTIDRVFIGNAFDTYSNINTTDITQTEFGDIFVYLFAYDPVNTYASNISDHIVHYSINRVISLETISTPITQWNNHDAYTSIHDVIYKATTLLTTTNVSEFIVSNISTDIDGTNVLTLQDANITGSANIWYIQYDSSPNTVYLNGNVEFDLEMSHSVVSDSTVFVDSNIFASIDIRTTDINYNNIYLEFSNLEDSTYLPHTIDVNIFENTTIINSVQLTTEFNKDSLETFVIETNPFNYPAENIIKPFTDYNLEITISDILLRSNVYHIPFTTSNGPQIKSFNVQQTDYNKILVDANIDTTIQDISNVTWYYIAFPEKPTSEDVSYLLNISSNIKGMDTISENIESLYDNIQIYESNIAYIYTFFNYENHLYSNVETTNIDVYGIKNMDIITNVLYYETYDTPVFTFETLQEANVNDFVDSYLNITDTNGMIYSIYDHANVIISNIDNTKQLWQLTYDSNIQSLNAGYIDVGVKFEQHSTFAMQEANTLFYDLIPPSSLTSSINIDGSGNYLLRIQDFTDDTYIPHTLDVYLVQGTDTLLTSVSNITMYNNDFNIPLSSATYNSSDLLRIQATDPLNKVSNFYQPDIHVGRVFINNVTYYPQTTTYLITFNTERFVYKDNTTQHDVTFYIVNDNNTTLDTITYNNWTSSSFVTSIISLETTEFNDVDIHLRANIENKVNNMYEDTLLDTIHINFQINLPYTDKITVNNFDTNDTGNIHYLGVFYLDGSLLNSVGSTINYINFSANIEPVSTDGYGDLHIFEKTSTPPQTWDIKYLSDSGLVRVDFNQSGKLNEVIYSIVDYPQPITNNKHVVAYSVFESNLEYDYANIDITVNNIIINNINYDLSTISSQNLIGFAFGNVDDTLFYQDPIAYKFNTFNDAETAMNQIIENNNIEFTTLF